jgi:hypothetical protein
VSLASRVSGLLHIPPPVLTAYLDVNPKNPRNQSTPRGYIKWLKSAGQALNNELLPSARKEFRKQLDRVNEYVQKARPRSRGLVVFAGQQTWEAIPLQVEVAENAMIIGRVTGVTRDQWTIRKASASLIHRLKRQWSFATIFLLLAR